jgi:hypothetical protein
VIATTSGLPYLRTGLLRGAVIAWLCLCAACAGPPVQEMSDARQAIRAAEAAGADQSAAVEMTQARALIKSAEDNIKVGNYRQAREHARLSRETAIEARRRAEGPSTRQP